LSRTAAHTARWLVCYDVGSGRRRRRLAARLEARGQRHQRSVFIVEATPDEMPALLRRCRALLAPTDKLHAWRLLADGRLLAGSAGPCMAGHWVA
jgi:CRISPR-associated endonuclease Cas2